MKFKERQDLRDGQIQNGCKKRQRSVLCEDAMSNEFFIVNRAELNMHVQVLGRLNQSASRMKGQNFSANSSAQIL